MPADQHLGPLWPAVHTRFEGLEERIADLERKLQEVSTKAAPARRARPSRAKAKPAAKADD